MLKECCPLCGRELVLRGSHAGRGRTIVCCSGYPNHCSGYVHKLFCSECKSPMVIRFGSSSIGGSRYFWGCSNYPKCKHTESLENVNTEWRKPKHKVDICSPISNSRNYGSYEEYVQAVADGEELESEDSEWSEFIDSLYRS